MKYKLPIEEKISVVRDSFSKYLGVSVETPVIIFDRNKPKSVLISYEEYIKKYHQSNTKNSTISTSKKKKKYSKFSDFIGIGNSNKRKIDINKELDKAWAKDY